MRPHVAGIERADSVTWDAHKTLPLPMGAGMFFCRARQLVDSFFSVHTGYVPDALAGRDDLYQHSLQWSRRFIGLKVFLTLAELGGDGIAALIDHQAAMAQLLRERLVETGWRVMNDTPLPLVCFTRDDLRPDATADLARRRRCGGRASGSPKPACAAASAGFAPASRTTKPDASDVDALVLSLRS